MASIVKRGKSYAVVYRYKTDNGDLQQKWESGLNYKNALKRKAEIESQQLNGDFIKPDTKTVAELLEDFVKIYGVKRWSPAWYMAETSLIQNYINPLIGQWEIQKITPKMVDQFIETLARTPVVTNHISQKGACVSEKNTVLIIKLLRCAFNQAVRWGDVGKNVFTNALVPKTQYNKRDIWDIDTIHRALDVCTDPLLSLAMNLSFACSLRIAEICGLKWEDVHISEEEILNNDAYIFIRQELVRASLTALEAINQKDIYFVFPPLIKPSATTRLVLKKPKTETSIRKIWLPKTVAYMLRNWKIEQDKQKNLLGSSYFDYGLVMALEDGRPCEEKIIEKHFNKLKVQANLPNVVFHSLRHASTTMKLRITGDIKSVQGDTGHAQASMVTQVYSHVLDEDRKKTAQKFEESFYATSSSGQKQQTEQSTNQLNDLISMLTQNPDLLKQLSDFMKEQNLS